MARGSSGKADGGNNRIRFVMLEADLNDGNFQQITQAIANAVKPAQAPVRLLSGAQAAPISALDPELEEAEYVSSENGDESDGNGTQPASRPRRQRAPQVPTVLDIDLSSGDVPWEDYARDKNPKKETKRFLTVCRWFKDHRKKDAIGVDEVYTCYRKAGWPYGIKDFDAVFRLLKKNQYVKRVSAGQYAINQLGESVVDKLGSE
jgi:hypothetical protein